MGKTVEDFFTQLEKKVEDGTNFITWYGELYFELHRGTYTTQANNKVNNRKSEIMMRDIEYLATLATMKSQSYKYPKKDIDDIWENILLCQFHDCLPGSSIEMCYDDSSELYAANFETGTKLRKEALSVLGLTEDLNHRSELAAINTLSWSRNELVKIANASTSSTSSKQPAYALASGGPGLIKTISPSAISQSSTVSVKEVSKGVFQMSNSDYKLEIDRGCITSLIDRFADREVISKSAGSGKANQLVIFDDKPLYWQAWDVEVFHLDSRKVLESGESKIVEKGPYKASIATTTQISEQSWIKTTISLSAYLGNEAGYIEVDA